MVYIVIFNDNNRTVCISEVFESEEDAQKYCKRKNELFNRMGIKYYVEEWYVRMPGEIFVD